ncbi:MAG: AgmX/PglI C-terminal domain-containing protein, partial [Myxococcota bacterium]
DLELARAVLEGTLRQLAPTDRVTVRVADVTARSPDGAPELPAEATPELKETLLESLARVNVGGATDLGTSLRDAARLVAGKPRGAVLYLGDAQPTSGALDATALRRQLATLDAPPRFFGIAMGEHANLTLLRALFGDAQAAEIGERTEAPRLLMRFLADAARPTLRGVSVDLGEGVERVFPRPPITLADGHHLRLVGRLVDDLPTSVRIRGTRDGTPFEETMALTPTRADDHGDIRRRWAVHRLTELIDAQAGKESLAELGVRFSVLTPWTSLVVDGDPTATYEPILNFDDNPRRSHWATPLESLAATRGWRRRMPTATEEAAMVPEHTWVRRGGPVPEGEPTGDGGLRQATMQRIVSTETRGPQACYERKLLVRPDLRGDVSVELTVAGDGTLADAKLATTNLRAEDVETCILTEVRGLRFPASAGGETTTIRHTYEFRSPGRAIGVGRQCSDASRQGLEVRAALWRERLVANAGVRGALSVYREAQAQCELSDWRSRRTLLQAMLRSLGAIDAKLRLYVALGAESATGRYLRRAILLSVRTPADVAAVRAALNLDVALDYTVFLRLWKRNEDPEARLRLVREWLEAAPDDFDLRLRLLALLEETGKLQEARRLARELRADPLADARVRTAVGEFWRRQDNDEEARRVFSEIVERAPLDPWARRRLGDLYRAHGWPDDAYREYQTLRRLRPGDPSVLLDLAAAAADAGRVDEALRLEQELSESAASDRAAGAARYARLWNQVRLARLRGSADATLRPRIQERMRRAGVLRNPPALLVALTWAHPADAPQLFIQYPQEGEEKLWSRTDEQGTQFRIEAAAIREREPGSYLFEVRREDAEDLRPLEGELLVIAQPYTPDERILRLPVTLPRGTEKVGFELSPRDELTENLE